MKVLFTFLAISLTYSLFAQQKIAETRKQGEGARVSVSGIVINGSELGGIRYVQDSTAGIAIYSDKLNNIKRGDSISVTGEIHSYNNLFEITNVTDFNIHSSNHKVPFPKTITAAEIGEKYEGQIVQLNNISFLNPNGTFSGNTNYDFIQDGNWGVMRISSNSPIVGQPVPTKKFDLHAICSQYSTRENDTLSGYQLLPRDMDDFILKNAINITSPVGIKNINKNGFTLTWKTDNEASSHVIYGLNPTMSSWTNVSTGMSVNENNEYRHEVEISGLNASEIIYAKAFSVFNSDTAFSLPGVYATESNSSGKIEVYFNTPVNTNLSTHQFARNIETNQEDTLIAYIDRAKESIDFCIYNFNSSGLSDVSEALNRAFQRGVKVRFITSGTTSHSGTNDLLMEIPVLESPDDEDYGIMHNKFALFDTDSEDPNTPWVWTGSLNISFDQVNSDANNIVFIQDQTLAKAYKIEFEEMWGGSGLQANKSLSKFGKDKSDNTPHEFIINGNRIENYFSPSDNTNQKIINAIKTADNDLNIETMLITRTDIAFAISEVKQRGVEVQVLSDEGQSEYPSVNNILHTSLPNNKFIIEQQSTGIQHNKVAIIDANYALSDPQVITGSHNWSNSANIRNDENTLIIHNADIANQYFQQFAYRFEENGGSLVVSAVNIGVHDIKIYPNPSQGEVNIYSSTTISKVDLYSLSGKIIKQHINVNSKEIKFNIHHNIAGIYILKVQLLNGNMNTYKILKR